jgi:hypothetical protein
MDEHPVLIDPRPRLAIFDNGGVKRTASWPSHEARLRELGIAVSLYKHRKYVLSGT